MIVVADTTPLNYLILIGHAEVLSDLYRRVLIPQAVFEELHAQSAPTVVRAWVSNHPSWLEVQQVSFISDAALEALDAGEREAIMLAEQVSADLLLIDEREGRREAIRRNLSVTGTLGVLDEAAERGLINLPEAIEQLRQTSFRASPQLLQLLLDRHKR